MKAWANIAEGVQQWSERWLYVFIESLELVHFHHLSLKPSLSIFE